MFQGKRVGAILLMAGSGARFGSDTPKQFHMLKGKPVYKHALDTLKAFGAFDEILLVTNSSNISEETLVKGGKSRQESSYLGLKAFSLKPEIVLIHDGARPFLTERIIQENLEMALEYGAVDTCIASSDTLVYAPSGKAIETIPLRSHILRGQTPQTFRYDWILEAHEKALKNKVTDASDDCSLVLQAGYPVHTVRGEEKNIKITTALDLKIAHLLAD